MGMLVAVALWTVSKGSMSISGGYTSVGGKRMHCCVVGALYQHVRCLLMCCSQVLKVLCILCFQVLECAVGGVCILASTVLCPEPS
jgi:hypothetical protein